MCRFKTRKIYSFYCNRYENLEENIEIPQILLKLNKTDFFDFTIDDFSIVHYNPIRPQLKLDLGI